VAATCRPAIPYAEIGTALGEIVGAPARIRRWSEQAARLMHELVDIDVVHYAFDPITARPPTTT